VVDFNFFSVSNYDLLIICAMILSLAARERDRDRDRETEKEREVPVTFCD